MQRAIIIITLILLSFLTKAQVYQAMPQAGYGPVKRFLTDSVLTIPLNINALRNITGGRDVGQIRYNVTDSGLYFYSGYQWIKANLDSSNISNRINGKLNVSDTASMLSVYLRKLDTASLSNRIDLRVKYSDTAQMLLPYLRKLDTASLSRRIDLKLNSLTLTTNFKSGAATYDGSTLNIPKYSDTLSDNYVPYVGANKNVDIGSFKLSATKLKTSNLLEIQNQSGVQNETLDYTSLTPFRTGFSYYTEWLQGATTYTQSNIFNYANQGQQNNSRSYNLPVRNGTIALVEDTVNLSNRINLKLNISDTASMLSPYLRKADTSSLSNRIDLRVKYSDTAAMLSPYLKSAVTSVGLSMPSAFSVSNSPITSTGTIAVTGAGTAAQYIRGDGQLATLPSGASGGSSVNYYLNGSVNQGTIGGSVYYEMNKTSVIGAGTDFALAGNGLISQFITDVADPNRLQIPAGNWNFEIYMSASSSGGTPEFYVELLKYDGTNFTSIASSSANPEAITGGTTIDLYLTALAIPQTTLLATDRLAIRVYIVNSTGGRTITMHTENSHLCEIITNFAGGVSALNGLTANTQYLAVGTSGNDFAINSLTDTHTFDLPTASSTKRGALSSADWSTFDGKMNYSDTVSLSNRINLKLNISDTASMLSPYLRKVDTSSLSNRINTKQNTITLTTNNTSGAATFTSNTLNIPQYQAAGTYVTSVTGTSPIVSSGGTTPAISIPAATSSVNGYLSSTDWTTFNNKVSSATLSGYVTLSTDQTITGFKTFSSSLTLSNGTSNGFNFESGTTGFFTSLKAPAGLGSSTIVTLPSTSGTLALTNDLSGYLPLTGGTLTGALGGTSATFSGALATSAGAAINSANGSLSILPSSTRGVVNLGGTTDNFLTFANKGYIGVGSNYMQVLAQSGVALSLVSDASTVLSFALASGAATFSSSVTATQLVINAPSLTTYGSLNATTNAYAYQEYKYNSTAYGYLGQHSSFISGASSTDLGIVSVNNLIFGTGASFTERLRIASTGAATFSSLGTGTVTASSGTLSTVSDSSYKIADGFIEDALPSVMNLKPRYFYWKDKSGLDTTIRQLGFYAQEVNSAIGEEAANTPKKDSPWGITDRSLIAFLTKAIQELSVKNEALIKRIETLENK